MFVKHFHSSGKGRERERKKKSWSNINCTACMCWKSYFLLLVYSFTYGFINWRSIFNKQKTEHKRLNASMSCISHVCIYINWLEREEKRKQIGWTNLCFRIQSVIFICKFPFIVTWNRSIWYNNGNGYAMTIIFCNGMRLLEALTKGKMRTIRWPTDRPTDRPTNQIYRVHLFDLKHIYGHSI